MAAQVALRRQQSQEEREARDLQMLLGLGDASKLSGVMKILNSSSNQIENDVAEDLSMNKGLLF